MARDAVESDLDADSNADDVSTASTPASLASPTRPARPAHPGAEAIDGAPRRGPDSPAVGEVHRLCTQARTVRSDAASMRGVLHMVRGHLAALQQQLGELQREAAQQRRLADIRVMEKECEARLAQSEAASYELAARARGSALATMQA